MNDTSAPPPRDPISAPPPAAPRAGAGVLALRQPAHLVSPRVRVGWRVASLLFWVWPLLGVGVWLWFDWGPRGWQYAALGLLVLAAAIDVAVVPQWRYRVHRWEVTPHAVYTQSGWLRQERRVAPISRIQTVDSEFGPIERLLGLGTLTVTTASAAGELKVAGLERARVEELVDRLTHLAASARGDAT